MLIEKELPRYLKGIADSIIGKPSEDHTPCSNSEVTLDNVFTEAEKAALRGATTTEHTRLIMFAITNTKKSVAVKFEDITELTLQCVERHPEKMPPQEFLRALASLCNKTLENNPFSQRLQDELFNPIMAIFFAKPTSLKHRYNSDAMLNGFLKNLNQTTVQYFARILIESVVRDKYHPITKRADYIHSIYMRLKEIGITEPNKVYCPFAYRYAKDNKINLILSQLRECEFPE